MWMARRQEEETLREWTAEVGQVTMDGPKAGVALAGERRNVKVCLPGGYYWTPAQGDAVLVVKSGPEQAPWVMGVEGSKEDLTAGEVYLSVKPGTGIRLRKNGVIQVEGDLQLTGNLAITGSLNVNGREV